MGAGLTHSHTLRPLHPSTPSPTNTQMQTYRRGQARPRKLGGLPEHLPVLAATCPRATGGQKRQVPPRKQPAKGVRFPGFVSGVSSPRATHYSTSTPPPDFPTSPSAVSVPLGSLGERDSKATASVSNSTSVDLSGARDSASQSLELSSRGAPTLQAHTLTPESQRTRQTVSQIGASQSGRRLNQATQRRQPPLNRAARNAVCRDAPQDPGTPTPGPVTPDTSYRNVRPRPYLPNWIARATGTGADQTVSAAAQEREVSGRIRASSTNGATTGRQASGHTTPRGEDRPASDSDSRESAWEPFLFDDEDIDDDDDDSNYVGSDKSEPEPNIRSPVRTRGRGARSIPEMVQVEPAGGPEPA